MIKQASKETCSKTSKHACSCSKNGTIKKKFEKFIKISNFLLATLQVVLKNWKLVKLFGRTLHLKKYSSTQFGKRRGVSLVPGGGASAFFITSLVEEVWEVQKTWERERERERERDTHTHTHK